MEEYLEILRLNDVDDQLDLNTAKQIEDGLFAINGKTLNFENRIKYEILSLQRRLLDYSAENIGNDEQFDMNLKVIKEYLELGEYEKAKYALVKLSYKLKAPTRFYTVLFNFKKTLEQNNYKYTREDDNYGNDNNFGGKKK